MSIDGTDFRITQKGRARKGNLFASFKYKGKSALRYEIGLSILEGNLIWIEGPYPAGKYNDITIFRKHLIHRLGPSERVVADKGYVGEAPRFVKCPNSKTLWRDHRRMTHLVSGRHETINNRFKFWGILKQVYRHNIIRHGSVVRAIGVITQLDINNGVRLYNVEYDDIN